MKLSVVIVTRNRRQTLLGTLERVRANPSLPHGRMEILVVDNGSTDGTPDALAAARPDVRLVRLKTNEGVSARNHGFAIAAGQYILLIDDDSYPLDDAVARSLDRLDAAPDVGAVVGRVLLPDGSPEASAMPSVMICCAVCIRKSVLDRVGGLPTDFVRQAEEYDLSFRLWDAGYRVERYEDLIYRHEKVAGNRVPSAVQRYDMRNNLVLLDRYVPEPLRRIYREDWSRRYLALARQSGCLWASRLGQVQADLRRLLRREPRREPISPAAIESIFELDSQARRVERWARQTGVRRVVLADWSKNLWATFDACRRADLEVVALADNGPAFASMRYRGLRILPDAAAAGLACDAVVLSNTSPARVASRAVQLQRAFERPVLTLWDPQILGTAPASVLAPAAAVAPLRDAAA